jgi:putative ABC transport system substrate-binding protein
MLDKGRREFFMALFAGAAVALPLARAQQPPGSTPRVAFLGAESASTNRHFFEAFSQGLREHGYVDGQNVTLVERWGEGRSERFPELCGNPDRWRVVLGVARLPHHRSGRDRG